MKIKPKFKMGNVLCKNRKNQNTKGSLDGIIGRCTQICHNPIGKKKHFWDKQILETSPPCRAQPKKTSDSGWSTVSLTVPDGPSVDHHPVAPPRKKRISKQNKTETIDKIKINSDSEEEKIKITANKTEIMINENKNNGSGDRYDTDDDDMVKISVIDDISISDNFIKESSPISIEEGKDEVDKQDINKHKIENFDNKSKKEYETESEENKSITSSPSRNILGNRKSDKFFGENISESLSNQPITESSNNQKNKPSTDTSSNQESLKTENHIPKDISDLASDNKEKLKTEDSKDETDHQVVKIENVENSEDMEYQIKKEKGNLLFAIESQVPDKSAVDVNSDMKPVEEEIIVPIHRQTRHICDDDTHIHDVLHKATPTPDVIPPKKPQRDFSKYRKSIEGTKSDDVEKSIIINSPSHTVKTTIKSKSTSEEELLSDAETLPLDESSSSPSSPLKNQIDASEQQYVRVHHSSDVVPLPNLTKSEKILQRCLDSQSYLTTDLIEAITHQANDSPMSPDGYQPEDYRTSSNDGSCQFSPISTSTEKKHKTSQSSLDESSKITKSSTVAGAESPKVDKNQECFKSDISEKDENQLNLHTEDRNEYLPNYEEATGIPRHATTVTTTQVTLTVNSEPQIQEDNTSKKPLPIDPGFHRKVSSTKEISDAIRTFISKDDHDPKEVLKILEEEFGNLLNSSCLSTDDQEIIRKLRESATNESGSDVTVLESSSKTTTTVPATIINNKSIDNSELIQNKIHKIPINNETEMNCSSSNLKIETEIDLKSPAIIHKALKTVMSNEKRRHSIDDLDTWFTSSSTTSCVTPTTDSIINDNENIETTNKLRRREASLPNTLDITTTSLYLTSNNNHNITTKENHQINQNDHNSTDSKNLNSEIIVSNKNDHSPLLKFLENEKLNYNH